MLFAGHLFAFFFTSVLRLLDVLNHSSKTGVSRSLSRLESDATRQTYLFHEPQRPELFLFRFFFVPKEFISLINVRDRINFFFQFSIETRIKGD